MLNFSSKQKIKIFFTLYRITYAQKIFEYDFEKVEIIFIQLFKKIYIYILNLDSNSSNIITKENFFFKAMNFHSRINFHSILARNIHTHIP